MKFILNAYFDEMKILSHKSDAIVFPISLDGIFNDKLSLLLFNKYQELEYKITNNYYKNRFDSGSIFLYDKSTPKIIVTPLRYKYYEELDSDLLMAFINKLNAKKEDIGINSVSIDIEKFTKEQIELIKNNKNFIVKFFNKKDFIEEI